MLLLLGKFLRPETMHPSMECRQSSSPRFEKFSVQNSVGKVIALSFWDCHGKTVLLLWKKLGYISTTKNKAATDGMETV